MVSARKWEKCDSETRDEGTLGLQVEGGISVQDTLSPIRWGLVGLGWVATDFIAPAMVQNPNSRLAACLGSSLAKGHAFAERFGVERVHGDIEALMHDPDVDAVYIALPRHNDFQWR